MWIKENERSSQPSFVLPTAGFWPSWLELRNGLAVLVILGLPQLLGGLSGGQAWKIGGPAQSGLALAAGLLATFSLASAAIWSILRSRRARLAWAMLAGAAACFAMGRAARLIWPNSDPANSLVTSGLFDLVYSALFFTGVLLLPDERIAKRSRARLGLDIIIVVTSTLFVKWLYYLNPVTDHAPVGVIDWLGLALYPLGDTLLLWAVILLIMLPSPGRFEQPQRLLATAGIAAILANFFMADSLAGTVFSTPLWPGLLQLLAACLLILAGMTQCSLASAQPPQASARREPMALEALRQGAPTLWVGLVVLLTLGSPLIRSIAFGSGFTFWVVGIIGLVITRQIFEMGENRRLDQELQVLESKLEERVAQRTTELVQANQTLRHEMSERAHIEKILREREEAMEHAAMHDSLTGLPNRLLLAEHLRQAIRKIQRWDNYQYALLFLDFDGFKLINDRLGHHFGDHVLVAIANRLRRCVREVDTVSRLGGDEFVVLLGDVVIENGTCLAVDRIRGVLTETYEIEGQRIDLSASIGVVIGDRSYQDPAELLRDADLAMYEAKALGKDRYVIFKSELRKHALDRLVLEDDLRTALARDELLLHFHPILSLDTHRITGFEALVRWQHPQRGLIMPDTFIPVAETSQLIVPLTRRVLQLACAQLKQWQASHPADRALTISVNLSPKLFSQPGIIEMVDEILAETGLPAHFLKLEITEGAMVEDNQGFLHTLQLWKERGIQIQMDDFGTGYASLSYLHQFPIKVLKIDRTFIQRIQPNGEQSEIARTIITLARELHLDVIAEGVETIDQLAFLESLGCQFAQGYLIAQPLPSEDVQPFLRTYTSPALPAYVLEQAHRSE